MRFIAYWNRGKEHCNIQCDYYAIDDDIIRLVTGHMLVGWFDMGMLDAWYVSGNERKEQTCE